MQSAAFVSVAGAEAADIFMDTSIVVPSRPTTPSALFCDGRFLGRADWAMLACRRCAFAPCNFHAVVSARSDALVCESPKRWRSAFALLVLAPDGLQHIGASSTNRGKRTPNHCLMLKKLKLSIPWSTEAHANRQLSLFVVFSFRQVCSALRRLPFFFCPTREKHLRSCVVKVTSRSGGVL